MARSRPVRICVIRQIPRRDPKFHQAEMFEGVGRSIRELFITFRRGWCFRRLGAIRLSYSSNRMIRIDSADDPR